MPIPAGPRVAVEVPVVTLTVDGIDPPAGISGDLFNHHRVDNDGFVFVEARNADGSNPHAVSKFARPVDGQPVDPCVYVIPPGGSVRFKLGHPVIYGKRVRLDVDSPLVKLAAYTPLDVR